MTNKWQEFKIGELCDFVSETYRGKDEKVVTINTSDVFDGKVLNHELIDNINLPGQFKKTFKQNDILYSEIRPINRRNAFVDFPNTSLYLASTKLMVLRPNSKVVPKYLFYILNSDEIVKELQHLAETRSGTFPQITFSNELAPITVRVPPIEIQSKIVQVLNNIDKKIETNLKINEVLLQYVSKYCEELFLQRDPNSVLSEIVIQNQKSKVQVGEAKNKIGAYPFFTSGDAILSFDSYIVDGFNVFVNTGGNADIKFYIGKASYSTDTWCISGGTYSYFLFTILLLLKDEINRVYFEGSALKHLQKKKLFEKEIYIPNADELNEFNKIAAPSLQLVSNNRFEIKKLKALKNTLLPGLISGEIDVSGIEIEE